MGAPASAPALPAAPPPEPAPAASGTKVRLTLPARPGVKLPSTKITIKTGSARSAASPAAPSPAPAPPPPPPVPQAWGSPAPAVAGSAKVQLKNLLMPIVNRLIKVGQYSCFKEHVPNVSSGGGCPKCVEQVLRGWLAHEVCHVWEWVWEWCGRRCHACVEGLDRRRYPRCVVAVQDVGRAPCHAHSAACHGLGHVCQCVRPSCRGSTSSRTHTFRAAIAHQSTSSRTHTFRAAIAHQSCPPSYIAHPT
eukprot:35069-Chlamydomonas_euryale.AAC.1